METVDARTEFLLACGLTATVVGSPEVAERWGNPSVLAGLTVGGLAGHTYLATRLVDRHLDEPEPRGRPVRRPGEYYHSMRVDDVVQLDEEVHRTVRRDGEYVARRGAAALAEKFAELVGRLGRRLPLERPDRVLSTSVTGAAARLDDFLANRTIELLVHADDLATSAGLPPIVPPTNAATLAIMSLLAVAREQMGDRAVLRALSGRDRGALDGLRVL